jgi:hypothetical protein
MGRTTWLWLTALVLLFGAPTVDAGTPAEGTAAQSQVVTGTLTKLDWASGKGLVTTDLGKPVFFEVTKPHLFENLSVGARVTVEIDGYGRVNKITDASIAEFLPPSEETDMGSIQSVGLPVVGLAK